MQTIYYKDAIVGEMVTSYLLIGDIVPTAATTLEELAAQQYFNGEPFFAADTIQGGYVHFDFPEFPNGTDVNVYGLFIRDKDGDLVFACKLDEHIHADSGKVISLSFQIIPYKAAKPLQLVQPLAKTIECSETAIMMSDIMHLLQQIDMKPAIVNKQGYSEIKAHPQAEIDWAEPELAYDPDIDPYDPP